MKRATATALSCVVLGWFYFAHLDDPLARQVAYPFNYRDVVMAAAEKEQVPPSLVASVIALKLKSGLVILSTGDEAISRLLAASTASCT